MPQWYYNLGEKEDTPLDQILGVYKHVNFSTGLKFWSPSEGESRRDRQFQP